MSGEPALLEPEDLARRLLRRDLALWPLGSRAAQHLDWIDTARDAERQATAMARFAASVDEATVIVLGLGVVPSAVAGLIAVRDAHGGGERRVLVCDTTDPEAIADLAFEDAFALVIAAGPESEPEAAALLAAALSRGGDARRTAVVAPARSRLAAEAADRAVREIFVASPGGDRFGALGLAAAVPAALAGYDVAELAGRVLEVDVPSAVAQGLVLASAVREGNRTWEIELADDDAGLGPFIEAFVAGALGGESHGCIAVTNLASETHARRSGTPALRSALSRAEPGRLGELIQEVALITVAAAWALGIDPFAGTEPPWRPFAASRLADPLDVAPGVAAPEALAEVLAGTLSPEEYVSVTVDVPGVDAAGNTTLLEAITAATGAPVLVAPGPRARHAWGALRTGGPPGLALSLVSRRPPPERADSLATLGALSAAASAGEHDALVSAGRRVYRIGVDGLDEVW